MDSVTSGLFALVQLAGVAAILFLALAAVRRWPMLILWLVAAVAVVAWEIPNLPALGSFGGLEIKTEDAIFVVVALDVLSRPQRFVAITRSYAALVVFLAVCLGASLVAGFLAFGPGAFNEARNYFWGVALVAWMLNINWSALEMQQRLRRWATVVGWVLVAVFVYHAARYGMGTADSFVEFGVGQSQTGRPLVAQQAMLLACVGFMMFWRTEHFERRVFAGLAFIMVAALCQHRSVWLAIALGALMVLPKIRGRALANTVFWGAYACIVLACFFLIGTFDVLLEQLSYAVTSAGTYNEREASWQLLIARAIEKGPAVVTFGEPFGAGYDRVVNGVFVTYSPHNWFVMIFLRLGLAGFLAYMTLMAVLVLPKLLRAKSAAGAAFVAILAFSWTYSMPWTLSPIIGWCIYQAWRNSAEQPPADMAAATLNELSQTARVS